MTSMSPHIKLKQTNKKKAYTYEHIKTNTKTTNVEEKEVVLMRQIFKGVPSYISLVIIMSTTYVVVALKIRNQIIKCKYDFAL